MKAMTKKWRWLMLMGVGILAIFVHFYQLDEIPYGLHIDEAAMAYDAYTLAQLGTDRYLNPYPVYLLNFGAGQSALYAYLTMILIKIAGLNTWTIRLPGAILSLVMLLAVYQIFQLMWDKKTARWGTLLIVILPYFIMQSRFGLDCNLFLCLSTLSLALLLQALKNRHWSWFLGAGVSLGLTLYTYALSYLILPVFLGLITIYLWRTKRLNANYWCLFLPLIILSLPLLVFVIINHFSLPAIKTSWFTIPRLWLFRENELTMKYLGSNFLTISHDSFLPDWLDYNALAPFGTMYLISIPLVILGMIKSGRQVLKCSCSNEAIMWLFYGSVFGVGLFITGPNINKMNGLYLPLAFFLVSGIKQLLEITTSKKAVLILVVIIYGAQFVQFTHYYFVRYPQEIYPQSFFADTFEPGFAWVAREYPGRTVYFAENYIYCLLGTRADAREIDWHEVINQGHYRHYRFALPAQPTNEQGVYLVRETNARYLALLKNAGLQLVYTTGMYQVWAKTGD